MYRIVLYSADTNRKLTIFQKLDMNICDMKIYEKSLKKCYIRIILCQRVIVALFKK